MPESLSVFFLTVSAGLIKIPPFLTSLLCTSELRSCILHFMLLTMTEASRPYNFYEVNSVSSPQVYVHGQSKYTYLPEAHQLSILLLFLQRKQTVVSMNPSLGTWADAPKDLMGLCSMDPPNLKESHWISTANFSPWKG